MVRLKDIFPLAFQLYIARCLKVTKGLRVPLLPLCQKVGAFALHDLGF